MPTDSRTLGLMSVSKLLQTPLPPQEWLVRDLIAVPGLYMLVGGSKTRKSFLAADLGVHVTSGEDFWGREVSRAGVVYYALEDSDRRLQSRIGQMTDVADEGYLYKTEAPPLDGTMTGGLVADIRATVALKPETRLVIIDTLGKVRNVGGQQNAYQADYRDAGQLKAVADECGIAVLVVHHTRKMKADDPFDTISGTNGLMGASDAAFVLKLAHRGAKDGTLYVTGRDAPDQRLEIRFNDGTLEWELVHEATEREVAEEQVPDDILAVRDFMVRRGEDWSGRTSELLDAVGIDAVDPRAHGHRLNRFRPFLEGEGIACECTQISTGTRWTLTLKAQASDEAGEG